MQKNFCDDISNGFRSGGFLTLVARATRPNEPYGCAWNVPGVMNAMLAFAVQLRPYVIAIGGR